MVIVNQFWYSLDDSNTLPEFALEMMEHNKKKVDIHLWTYQKLKNVPSGVKMRNASEIVPYSFFKEKVLKYTKKKWENQQKAERCIVVSFSDYFRNKLLYKDGGWWIDTDVLLLKPLPSKQVDIASLPRIMKGLYRRQKDTFKTKRLFEADINTSVLKWDKENEILKEYIDFMEDFYEKQDDISVKRLFKCVYFIKNLQLILIKNNKESYVSPPIIYNPMAAWAPTKMGEVSFGYRIPSAEEIKRHSITLSFSGEGLKKDWRNILDKINIIL